MRTRWPAWIALAGCLVSLGAAAAPTYIMEFMPPPSREEPFISYHSWFSPMMLVYGDPFPLLTSAVVTALTLVALVSVVGTARPVALVVLATVSLVVIGVDHLVFGSGILFGGAEIRGLALLVPGGALVVLATSLLLLRSARAVSA